MTIRKLDDGRYQLDTRTGGRGSKRVRRLFHRKSDAVSFERYMLGLQPNSGNDPGIVFTPMVESEIKNFKCLHLATLFFDG
ncbi:hypothetical protein GUD57_003045 [Salmonella enterica]|nr:hypothetical protein [Salmonella enterica]